MKNEYLENELIDKYLNGDLQNDELSAFEDKLKSDKNFKEKVDNQKAFNQSVEDYELAKFHRGLNEFNPYKGSSPSNWLSVKAIGIAALVVGVAAFSIWTTNTEEVKEVFESESVEEVSLTENKKELLDTSEESANELPSDLKNTEQVQEESALSMYDFMQDKPTASAGEFKSKKAVDEEVSDEEPSYIVKERPVKEEEVLVISSDYNKEKHLVEDTRCAHLTFDAKIEVVSDCKDGEGLIKIVNPKISGGKAPFEYSVNNNEFQRGLKFENLAFGSYQIRVKDAEDCVIEYHEKVKLDANNCE